MKKIAVVILLFSSSFSFAKTWVDSLDTYAREKFLPASRYQWKWQKAALLYAMTKQYDLASEKERPVYFDYLKKAMDKTYSHANGKWPNGMASGLGMAKIYNLTGDEKYKTACDKIFNDYLKMKRTKDGAVSHLKKNIELWDDTIFMIGEFLINMYKATKDDKYIDELADQIRLHREKLRDTQWGLWVHGWDSDNRSHCTFCGQMHWADATTRRSPEIWGRGNGWIVVTLSDALSAIPKSNEHYKQLSGYLTEMVARLPELQEDETGHWYQLPTRIDLDNNWIEGSCTAMFAYGELMALKLGLVKDDAYKSSVEEAYKGLRDYSIHPVRGGYISAFNVCVGTCIGDQNYYLKRRVAGNKPFGIGMFIVFGREYEKMKK